MIGIRAASFLLTSTCALSLAHADGTAVTAPPPPYSLAWQLRPAAAASVVRSDTTVAAYDAGAAGDGTTVASTLLASYKVTPELAPLVRFAVAHNTPPMGDGGTTVSNPLLGVTWARPLAPAVKLAVFGGVTLPVGTGGGDSPDATVVAANKAAMAARSAMDNALFAVNHATPIVGADIAYVAGGFTVQAEATLLQLIRVRGNDMTAPDQAITNFTSGIHAGYFPVGWLSIGGEVRYQRYLSTPAVVDANPAARDNLSTAIGVRGHFHLGGKRWLRPGLAYARGIDDPMSDASYHVVQIDVPLAF
jgi:hypothetical protein